MIGAELAAAVGMSIEATEERLIVQSGLRPHLPVSLVFTRVLPDLADDWLMWSKRNSAKVAVRAKAARRTAR